MANKHQADDAGPAESAGASSVDPASGELIRMTTSAGLALDVGAVRPSDVGTLKAGFDELSERTRYARFFTPMHDLSDGMLHRFVHPDQRDHIAAGALDASDTCPDAERIGVVVARAFRSQSDPTQADFAITVIDEYQTKGVGSLLLDVLAAACAGVGIDTLTAEVLTENRAMLRLIARRDGSITRSADDAAVSNAVLDVETLAARLGAADRQRVETHFAAEAARASLRTGEIDP